MAGAFACGSDESLPGWSGSVRDSASVRVVENSAIGAWTEDSRPAVEEVLRIGDRSGDPEYQFGRLSGLAVDSNGPIFSLDVQAQPSKIFNAESTS